MKNFLLILCLIFINVFDSTAQWVQTNGPASGQFQTLEIVGSSIWAGGDGGIYTSQNEGVSWSKLPGFDDECIDILCEGDTIVVLCASVPFAPATLYTLYTRMSTDGGITFSPPSTIETSTSSYTGSPKMYRINGKLLTGDIYMPWYVSNNNGTTWSAYTIPFGDDMRLVCNNQSLLVFEFTDFTLQTDGLYYTSDLQNFTVLDTVFNPTGGGLFNGNSLFLYFSDFAQPVTQYIVRTNDLGLTWDTVYTSAPLASSSGGCMHFNGGIYFYQYPDFIFSTNNGQSWQTMVFPAGFVPDYYDDNLTLSSGDNLSYLYPYGIVRYNPAQNIFYPSITGIKSQNVIGLSSNKGNLYCGSVGPSFMSMDGGLNWQKIPADVNYVTDFSFCGDTIIGAEENYSGHLIRSFDNGLTWDTITAPVGAGWSDPTSIEFVGNTLYSSSNVIFYSNDAGTTWDTLPPYSYNNPGSCTGGFDQNGFLANITGNLWLVNNSGVVYKFNAGTQIWTQKFCFWSTGANNGNRIYGVGNSIIVTGRTGMYLSSDGGNTWSSYAPSTLPVTSAYNFKSYNNIWVATCANYGVYFSTNSGASWAPMQTPVPFTARGGLTFLNGKLFSGSMNKSVWSRGGTFETIEGTVFNDVNNNLIQDNGENGIPNVIVQLKTSGWCAVSDSLGNYLLSSDVVGDSLEVSLPSFTAYSPSYYLSPTSSVQNYDFAVSFISMVSDFSVDLSSSSIFRPGFQTNLLLNLQNNGSVSQTSIASLQLDPALQFNSAIPSPSSIAGNLLTWNVDTLMFNKAYSININVETPVGSLLGDTIQCLASVLPSVSDVNSADNTFELSDVVQGSFDPNDKRCLQGDYFSPQQIQSGEELEFIVRFQNTGNLAATIVNIIDTLSPMLDWSTFKVLNASHSLQWNISGQGIAEFTFNNINLPAEMFDEPNSHGFVKYAVKCKSRLSIGDAVMNTAYIYFDFNPAIITNTTSTIILNPVILLNPEIRSNEELVLVYPNPATDIINLNYQGKTVGPYVLKIYSNYNLVDTVSTDEKLLQVKLSELANGIYFGTFSSQSGGLLKSFRFIINH